MIGSSDEKWGEIPVAFIVKKAQITEEEINPFCIERLAKYKIPRKIFFIDRIPRNAAKKILRRELRAFLNNDQISRKKFYGNLRTK